jgi:aminobenzoyl-glutamate transport protein
MNPPGESRKSGPQRLLDLVEKLGNKVPHSAVLFVLLIAVVVVLSYLL